jgi:hypothetical protein
VEKQRIHDETIAEFGLNTKEAAQLFGKDGN